MIEASWFGPLLAGVVGAAFWACGAKFSRQAVMLVGFCAGVPFGGMAAGWIAWSWIPPVVGAILGAFVGLIAVRIAYRCMLSLTIGVVAALLAAVLSSALVDRGAIAVGDLHLSRATTARAAALADSSSSEIQSNESEQNMLAATRSAIERFWTTLDRPEQTFVFASTVACGAAGLLLGFFAKRLAELVTTSILGSILIAWALGQAMGNSGPSLATWALATLVLSVAGMVVQLLSATRLEDSPASSHAETA